MRQWLRKIIFWILEDDIPFGRQFQTVNVSVTTLTDAANILWDFQASELATVTLAGNRTLDNPTGLVNGHTAYLVVKQDGTGSRTLAYGSAFKWPGGTAPVLSTGASAIDVLTFITDGTNVYGNILKTFS